jgi:putative hydrolase of the HAD superfamily
VSPRTALLLDAVGTLIRLREPPAATYQRVAEQHGVGRPRADLERDLAHAMGRLRPPRCDDGRLDAMPEREREGWRGVIRAALGDGAADGTCFDALWALYAEPEAWQVQPGAVAALEHARREGVALAIVSNMDARLPALLDALGFPAFDALVLPSNCGFAKPDARIFAVALERLRRPAAGALYVGDREKDCVEAARAAGLRAVRYDAAAPRTTEGVLRAWSDLGVAIPRSGLDSRA